MRVTSEEVEKQVLDPRDRERRPVALTSRDRELFVHLAMARSWRPEQKTSVPSKIGEADPEPAYSANLTIESFDKPLIDEPCCRDSDGLGRFSEHGAGGAGPPALALKQHVLPRLGYFLVGNHQVTS